MALELTRERITPTVRPSVRLGLWTVKSSPGVLLILLGERGTHGGNTTGGSNPAKSWDDAGYERGIFTLAG